jgi:hypothetical protein
MYIDISENAIYIIYAPIRFLDGFGAVTGSQYKSSAYRESASDGRSLVCDDKLQFSDNKMCN